MKSIHTLLVLAATAVAAPINAPAADNPMTPGEWEISTQIEMTGSSYKIPPHTMRHCITAADLAKSGGVPEPQSKGNTTCTMGDLKKSAQGVDWSMRCNGDANVQMEGKILYDSATQYHGTIRMKTSVQGHASEMKQSLQARRLGDCTK